MTDAVGMTDIETAVHVLGASPMKRPATTTNGAPSMQPASTNAYITPQMGGDDAAYEGKATVHAGRWMLDRTPMDEYGPASASKVRAWMATASYAGLSSPFGVDSFYTPVAKSKRTHNLSPPKQQCTTTSPVSPPDARGLSTPSPVREIRTRHQVANPTEAHSTSPAVLTPVAPKGPVPANQSPRAAAVSIGELRQRWEILTAAGKATFQSDAQPEPPLKSSPAPATSRGQHSVSPAAPHNTHRVAHSPENSVQHSPCIERLASQLSISGSPASVVAAYRGGAEAPGAASEEDEDMDDLLAALGEEARKVDALAYALHVRGIDTQAVLHDVSFQLDLEAGGLGRELGCSPPPAPPALAMMASPAAAYSMATTPSPHGSPAMRPEMSASEALPSQVQTSVGMAFAYLQPSRGVEAGIQTEEEHETAAEAGLAGCAAAADARTLQPKEELPCGRGTAVGLAVLLGAAAVAPMVGASAAMWLQSKMQQSTLASCGVLLNASNQPRKLMVDSFGAEQGAAGTCTETSVPAPPSPPHASAASSPQHVAAVRRATAALEAAARELAEALRQEAAAEEGVSVDVVADQSFDATRGRAAGDMLRDPTVRRLEDVLTTQMAPKAPDAAAPPQDSATEANRTQQLQYDREVRQLQAAAAARRKHLEQARSAMAA